MELFIIAGLLIIAAETTYLVIKQNNKSKHTRRNQAPIFVDTSVLIDGRIVAIAQSGFITSPLYVPRSVVGELQFLADNGDTDKRTRARHGLDVINELQGIKRVQTEIFADSTTAEEGVDNRLLSLAKQHKGSICTIDFNLNKVAQVEGIQVLNVNDLAKTLRMAYLPGEKIMLELTQKGNDNHQAVGHLADGTMVVVEHASQYVGKTMEVEFIRSLQTAAGKMMFARIVGKQQEPKQPRQAQSGRGRKPEQRTDARQKAAKGPQGGKPAQSAPKNAPRQARPQSRRRSPEDSLVELANKQ